MNKEILFHEVSPGRSPRTGGWGDGGCDLLLTPSTDTPAPLLIRVGGPKPCCGSSRGEVRGPTGTFSGRG
jgi:hypothetical protein